MLRPISNQYQQLSLRLRDLPVDLKPAFRSARVPLRQDQREDKLSDAKVDKDPCRRCARRPSAEGSKSFHARKDAQTGDRCYVMREEQGIEIGSYGKNQQGQRDPGMPVIPYARKKHQQRHVERRVKKETEVANTICEA